MGWMGAPYHQLWLHRLMLLDRARCEAYRQAIFEAVNPGDVVLDIGAGTGILSLFAAQAGARRVYAVERMRIAELARRLVAQNGAEDRVIVIQRDIGTVRLPERVDVIVSEWLGGYGVDENLLGRVLMARDRWLRPTGKMLPEYVTAWMAPVWDKELEEELRFFRSYPYDLDVNLIADKTVQELFWSRHHITGNVLLAEPQAMWVTDVYSCTAEDARSSFQASLSFSVRRAGWVNALAAWFRAEFGGSIVLTNAPDAPKTHWGRSIFPLKHAIEVTPGTRILVEFSCEPDRPGWSYNRWLVRVGNRRFEQHDTRWALW